jgi:hypothetical protein
MRAPRETDLVRACLAWLALNRIPAWRQNAGAATATSNGKTRYVRFCGADGVSDILGLLPPTGRMLAVECKVGKRQVTAQQAAFLAKVAEAGGLALVVRDLLELVGEIESLRS